MDEGQKLLEAIKLLNKHINEGKIDTVEGLEAMAKLLNRYNKFLQWFNEGRVVSLDEKYN
jgi:hypothetical protein